MSISQYIREIGRGKEGARSLTRVQAADLFGQVLDGAVSDLEVGAFCIAMRVKGETPEEMAGFLDATHARLQRVPAAQPVVAGAAAGARRCARAGARHAHRVVPGLHVRRARCA